jgi:hypothetical protein
MGVVGVGSRFKSSSPCTAINLRVLSLCTCRESPVEADVVSTVPTTSTPAALGFAYEAGIPYNEVLSKNRYVGRTFIQPDQRYVCHCPRFYF